MKRWMTLFVALAALVSAAAAAQDYPNKPVRIVVGFAAGSVSDLIARVIGQKLGAALGQPFIVEVRPGAGSNVAAQSRGALAEGRLHAVRRHVVEHDPQPAAASLGFDFGTDLAPVALIASVPFVLAAYPGLGVKTVQEFIALAKAKPESLTFGGTRWGRPAISRRSCSTSAPAPTW